MAFSAVAVYSILSTSTARKRLLAFELWTIKMPVLDESAHETLGLRKREYARALAGVLEHDLAYAAVIIDILTVPIELGRITRQE